MTPTRTDSRFGKPRQSLSSAGANNQPTPAGQNFLRHTPRPPSSDEWGDPMGPKPDNTLRVVLQNIGGFPANNWHQKNNQILTFINDHEIDVYAFTEMNVCWRFVPVHERLHERTLGWWETLHLAFAYNTQSESTSIYQVGGTALFSINPAAHWAILSGNDTTGLGRWCWTKYRG